MKGIIWGFFFIGFFSVLVTPVFSKEKLVEGPFKVTRKIAFENKNAKNTFVLSWKKVEDHSIDGAGKRSIETYIWYQTSLKVFSSSGRLIFEDAFSSKEDDFINMLERTGNSGLSPQQYFRGPFFKNFRTDFVRDADVDEEYLKILVKENKSKITTGKVMTELMKGQHMIIAYIGTWREDYRIFTYSRALGKAVRLLSDYEK
jgi:hypothetical protein